MKLLEAEPVVAPEAAPEAAPQATPEQPPAPPEGGILCPSCGAPMEPEQDWCLSCGVAGPGRLGERPGWRAASTVIGLTLLLVLGAVAAGYAALTHHGPAQVANTAPGQGQAIVPAATAPATPPPAAAPPATTPPAATATAPSTTPGKTKLPKVTPPKSSTSTGTPVIPVKPTTTPKTTTPAVSTPTTTTPTVPAPVAIKLADGATKIYDPYTRAAASGDAAKAVDGDRSTSWYVDPINPPQPNVGFVIDLGKLQGVREIQLTTPTPGFGVEIYATDAATAPPNILDTRWSHIKDASDVGTKDASGKVKDKGRIVLGAGTSKYRTLLLWFTKPPTDGTRIRLSELELLG
ncbi:MAG: hypothetical protein QOC78_4274 [Solirubrobacteraceae bacterium]|nr:hypothetical protein [Solirubrobacteraceae bacterium]